MSRVVLASNNAKKLAELRRILEPLVPGIEVLGLADFPAYDEPAETEPTFEGNALIKARAALQATGLPSLADDSGLCVDALNGMPGVLSARWSGVPKSEGGDAANNRLLLSQLSDVPAERRTAQFRCAMALCTPEGLELVEHGEMAGRILTAEHGGGGFGYDPLFAADGFEVSTAELDPADKDRISHRGKALAAIAPAVVAALTA
ncbi:RdgB/HAM1 family non-canonical purine NTP pyrophosphatase [Aeromicrobium sp. SMF47]|uniref:dITP/XTP pyrophosphatase n=1 Tax=Aeromicrobium yanjiei TaxID=2662028 RepID=A0A5Q2MI36_9ACTN|nr:RdgB/HAM1 family non-canonical purine NTP pyrophosphatase [Aeromicrobium yanjiei]MRJ78213.1 RdgB/HAM1 family non-canonical purine NTP pyrophosphatase [Aeromicrobium yanjiei]QGG40722.1 RdgB/HAM1 family non-canonical purine NTP pyrophosphatase [Aeromicrobium yanjiei]